MGKSTISMVIFNSYVCLPEGKTIMNELDFGDVKFWESLLRITSGSIWDARWHNAANYYAKALMMSCTAATDRDGSKSTPMILNCEWAVKSFSDPQHVIAFRKIA